MLINEVNERLVVSGMVEIADDAKEWLINEGFEPIMVAQCSVQYRDILNPPLKNSGEVQGDEEDKNSPTIYPHCEDEIMAGV